MKIVSSEFTNVAWNYFLYSKELAYKNNHQSIEADHLLLSMLRNYDITKKILESNRSHSTFF